MPHPDDRPTLGDIPVAITDNELEKSFAPRSIERLQSKIRAIAGLRVGAVMFSEFLKSQELVTHPEISRSAAGAVSSGFLTCDDILTKTREDERQKEAERQQRKECIEVRAANRASMDASAQPLREPQQGPGREGGDRGRGRRGPPVVTSGRGRWVADSSPTATQNRKEQPCR